MCDRGNLDDEMEDAHSFPPASRHPLHGAPRFFGSGTWGGGACAQAGGVAGGAGQQAATGVVCTGVVAGHGARGGAARYQPVPSRDPMHVSSSASSAYDASARGNGAPACPPSQAPGIVASAYSARAQAHEQADAHRRAYVPLSRLSGHSARSAADPAASAATTALI